MSLEELQPALFDGFGPSESDLELAAASADRRRTSRQARDVAQGIHPLVGGPLHGKADRTAKRADPKNLPYTCGTCVHRIQSRGYPTCDLTVETRGPATDVRAWWPACPAYKEKTS